MIQNTSDHRGYGHRHSCRRGGPAKERRGSRGNSASTTSLEISPAECVEAGAVVEGLTRRGHPSSQVVQWQVPAVQCSPKKLPGFHPGGPSHSVQPPCLLNPYVLTRACLVKFWLVGGKFFIATGAKRQQIFYSKPAINARFWAFYFLLFSGTNSAK